jgi:hypothetical protein
MGVFRPYIRLLIIELEHNRPWMYCTKVKPR